MGDIVETQLWLEEFSSCFIGVVNHEEALFNRVGVYDLEAAANLVATKGVIDEEGNLRNMNGEQARSWLVKTYAEMPVLFAELGTAYGSRVNSPSMYGWMQ